MYEDSWITWSSFQHGPGSPCRHPAFSLSAAWHSVSAVSAMSSTTMQSLPWPKCVESKSVPFYATFLHIFFFWVPPCRSDWKPSLSLPWLRRSPDVSQLSRLWSFHTHECRFCTNCAWVLDVPVVLCPCLTIFECFNSLYVENCKSHTECPWVKPNGESICLHSLGSLSVDPCQQSRGMKRQNKEIRDPDGFSKKYFVPWTISFIAR